MYRRKEFLGCDGDPLGLQQQSTASTRFNPFFVASCLLRSCRVRNSLLSLCPPASFARATCALRLFLAFLTLSLRFLACHHDLNPHRLSRLSGSPLLEHGS